jgi:serine/threonine-protein kinase PRP4
MTNSVNSGHKRSWDGIDHDHDAHKRRRGNEESQPKDWRDVHLKSPSRKAPPPAPRSVERRTSDGGRRRDEHWRSSDFGRDKERERGKWNDRDRARERERDRDRAHRDERRRSTSRAANARRTHIHNPPLPSQAASGRGSEEKEEGE